MNRFLKWSSALMLAGTVAFLCSCGSAPPPETHTVEIKGMKYIPEEITVNKGDTIIFINKDIVDHDVTQSDKAWASPTLKVGDSWKFVPEKSHDYYCSIHLVMKGKIIVP